MAYVAGLFHQIKFLKIEAFSLTYRLTIPNIYYQELKYDVVTGYHVLDALPKDFDVGKYEFVFKVPFY